MYKVKLGIEPSFMSDILKIRDISTDSIIRRLRSSLEFYNYDIPKSVRYGEETLRSLGPKVWHILPSEIIKSSVDYVKSCPCIFKNRIKLWIPKNCPCRLCKPYIANCPCRLSKPYIANCPCRLCKSYIANEAASGWYSVSIAFNAG